MIYLSCLWSVLSITLVDGQGRSWLRRSSKRAAPNLKLSRRNCKLILHIPTPNGETQEDKRMIISVIKRADAATKGGRQGTLVDSDTFELLGHPSQT